MEQSALHRGTAFYDADKNILKISVPGKGESDNTITLVLDFDLTLWTKYTYGIGVSAPLPYPTSRLQTYFGDPSRTTGKVYRDANIPTDDGVAFTALWRSGWLPLVEVGKTASISEWYTEVKYDSSSGLLIFSTFADENETAIAVDTIKSSKHGWRTTREEVNYIAKGERLSFQIEIVADTAELSGFRVDFRDEGVIQWSD